MWHGRKKKRWKNCLIANGVVFYINVIHNLYRHSHSPSPSMVFSFLFSNSHHPKLSLSFYRVQSMSHSFVCSKHECLPKCLSTIPNTIRKEEYKKNTFRLGLYTIYWCAYPFFGFVSHRKRGKKDGILNFWFFQWFYFSWLATYAVHCIFHFNTAEKCAYFGKNLSNGC